MFQFDCKWWNLLWRTKELLCYLEPPHPTNSQMTLAFSDSAIENIVTVLKKKRITMYACNWIILDWTFALVCCNILVGIYWTKYLHKVKRLWKSTSDIILSCFHRIFTPSNYPVIPIIMLTFIWKSIQLIFFLYNLYFCS